MFKNNTLVYSHHLEKVGDLYDEIKIIIRKNDVKINRISQNCFSISKDEKYLTIFPDGRIDFFATVCKDWEKFYIVDYDCSIFIEKVKRNYISLNDNKVEVEKIIHNDTLNVRINNKLVTPSFFPSGEYVENINYCEYKTLWGDCRVSLFKPLVYFCIYGGEEYYDCLRLAVESLISFGSYKGDILIKTDNVERCKDLFSKFDNKFIYTLIDNELGIFNRYLISDSFFENYSNIVYLDSDILTINNVYPLFSRMANKGDIVLYNEFSEVDKEYIIKKNSPWFGLDFVIDSPIETKTVYNSGFFYINNYKKVCKIFNNIINYSFLEKKYGDQPFLNIGLYNNGLDVIGFERNEGLSFSRSNYEFYENLDKTFIHYNSGVGDLVKKDLMGLGYNFILKKINY